jgi:mono/diheme cytochrome c family protein
MKECLMKRPSVALLVVLCVGIVACGKKTNDRVSKSAVPSDSTSAGADENAVSSGRGTGPVFHVDDASLDASRAVEGKQLFENNCSRCHRLDVRFIGPPLDGVTRRREPEWILNQILDPEVMINKDKIAKQMLGAYNAPMANRHVTRDQAESIYVYLREHDKAEAVGKAGTDSSTARPGQ